MASRVHSYSLPYGGDHLAVIAKRAYRLRPGARAEPLPEDPPIDDEPEYADSENAGALPRLVRDSDLFCGPKPLTDVLLRATARARGEAVTMLDTAVQIEQARTGVRVGGERRVEAGPGGALRFSTPEPFRELPIVWDHAYGGVDRGAEAILFPEPDAKRAKRTVPTRATLRAAASSSTWRASGRWARVLPTSRTRPIR
jgi:hypothetical protein